MKRLIIIFVIAMLFTACASKDQFTKVDKELAEKEDEYIQIKADNSTDNSDGSIITFGMEKTSNDTTLFLETFNDNVPLHKNDECYNVTPEDIVNKYGFDIYKFNNSCASFLLYDEKIYQLGEYIGGYGVTSFAVADIDSDGEEELYFTFSWGSGMAHYQIGYFDPQVKKIVIFDYYGIEYEAMLVLENNELCVYRATCNVNSFVDIELSAKEKLGYIVLDENDEITLQVDSTEKKQRSHDKNSKIIKKGESVKVTFGD